MQIIYWAMSVLVSLSLFGNEQPDFDYEKAWKRVEELRLQGLPKSALEEVDIILVNAKKEGRGPYQVKAIKIKSELIIETNEEGFDGAIAFMGNELKLAQDPVRQILSSYLAEMYNQYFQSNRYEIAQRSMTSSTDSSSYLEWNTSDFYDKIITLYLASLNGNKLEIPIDEYSDLLDNKEGYDPMIRPSLYAVLWDRLYFYLTDMNGQVPLALEQQYPMKDHGLLGNLTDFLQVKLGENQKDDPVYLILEAYQKILTHSQQKNILALADYDLSRLSFVYQHGLMPGKDSLYESTLRAMLITYGSSEYSSMVYHKLANHYQKLGKLKEALDLCLAGEKKYPDSPGASACRQTKDEILKKEASLITEEVFSPAEAPRFALDYKNVKQVLIKVWKIDGNQYLTHQYDNRQQYDMLLKNAKIMYSKSWDLPENKSYEMQKLEGVLPKLPLGKYVMEISSDLETEKPNLLNYAVFHVSDLAALTLKEDNKVSYRVVDRMTGKPLKGAKVTLYFVEYREREQNIRRQKYQEKMTDKTGTVTFPAQDNKRIQVVFEYGKDKLDLGGETYHYKHNANQKDFMFAEIYTDRAIYRPGQIAYWKVLAVETNGMNKHEVVAGAPVEVKLHDANYQVVATVEGSTNEFGSWAGSFTLPTGLLTGMYHISVQGKKGISGQKYFHVEEYKRPKFEVVLDTFSKTYLVKQNVLVSGRVLNLAGNPVDEAEISYKVVRGVRFIDWGWWWRPAPVYDRSEKVISFGNIKSGKDGTFNFDFIAIPDEKIPEKDKPVFDYRIEVTATDATGESQTQQSHLSVGYSGLLIKSELSPKSDLKTLTPFYIRLQNLQGVQQSGTGMLTMEKLSEPKFVPVGSYWENSARFMYIQELKDKNQSMPKPQPILYMEWPVEKQVWKGEFTTAKPVLTTPIKEAGVYRFKMETKDIFGNPVIEESYHIVTDFEGKKMPKSEVLHMALKKSSLEPGEKIELDLGASEKPVHAWLWVERNGEILYNATFKINSTLYFSYPVSEADRGGLHIHVQYVYKNRHHGENFFIQVPFTNKELDIRLETFRDKIYPGSQESYTFIISGKKKDAVLAEMMTTMFDASLETFQVNNWRQTFYSPNYSRLFRQAIGFSRVDNNVVYYDWNQINYEGNIQYLYPALRGIQVYGYGSYGMPYPGRRHESQEVIMESRAGREKSAPESAAAANEDMANPQTAPPPSPPGAGASKSEVTPPPAVRKNLAELVFFFPQLKTDKEGNVRVSFTMNEALTRWKMMTFAHTKDMKIGYDQRFVQTYKKVMVFPNAPRFVRTSDILELTAKVVNTTGEKIPTKVDIILSDAVTGEVITGLFVNGSTSKEVVLDANSSQGMSWKLEVPKDFTGTLSWTVMASSLDHSDGEENAIPVLTNKILVTETLPVYVPGKTKKDINFLAFQNNMSATKTDKRFTLEYSSHPVWYVIQALPFLAEQGYENTTNIINRYFANAVSSRVAQANPRIYKVFDQWKNQEKSVMISKLFSNQELKSSLAEETPWVLQGLKEEEQKRNIALLFETNQLKNELRSTFDKLKERQMSNGAFPWYVNGREDLYISQYVVETLGQMIASGALDRNNVEIMEMVKRAMAFIDTETLFWYKKNKGSTIGIKKDLPIHDLGVHYLYIRSFFPELALPDENKEMYDYYFNKCKQEWLQQNLYTQVLIGIVMQRSGDALAKAVKKSFDERSFTKEEMGMFWNAGNGYRWNELPIERHSKMIEFYTIMEAKPDILDKLKLWLLKNKQTRNWTTSKATASAVYALLLEGENSGTISWVDEHQQVSVSMGGQAVDFGSAESGTGYVKKQWSDQEFPKSWAKISVENPNQSVSWGAIYYQYFEDADKIKGVTNNPLKVYKTLYKVKTTNKGDVLEPIGENARLKPGDKVTVRLRIVSDRSMDYVHLKDARPSGFEPTEVLSGHRYQGGLAYYENVKDLATHFYISYLPKGDFSLEYNMKVVHKGNYSTGMATLQSMYAPEFSSHSAGARVVVD